MIDLP
jgi:hypothetical protein